MRVRGPYKRRVPWLGTVLGQGGPRILPPLVVSRGQARAGKVTQTPLPAPRDTPPRPTPPLVISQGMTRAGKAIWTRPPLTPRVQPGLLPARVISPSQWRRGQVIWLRQFKPKPPDVPGPVRPALLRRFEPPVRVRLGGVVLARLPGPTPLPVVRWVSVKARPDNQVVLGAGVSSQVSLGAGVKTSYSLQASAVMSISAKLTFFQGEDVILTFSLTPPQDMTGWTLTGTVRNQLGGTVQFTFTPTLLDTGRGVFRATWPRSSTSTLTPGDYVWDVRRTDTGNNSVLAHGEVTIKQPVTS